VLGSQQTQAAQIALIPACVGNHRFQGTDRKSVVQPMVRYDHSAAVSMSIYPVTTPRSLKRETILVKSTYKGRAVIPRGTSVIC
jgi:hypothetical protein